MSVPACRRARAADLDALVRLERGFPGERLSRRSLRRLLTRPSAEVWVAEGPAGVIADAVLLYRAHTRNARLYSCIVAPSARGRGVGARLLEHIAQAAAARGCARLSLEVREDNRAAIALYRKQGFRELCLRPGYYEDGQAALCMERSLAPAPSAGAARAATATTVLILPPRA